MSAGMAAEGASAAEKAVEARRLDLEAESQANLWTILFYGQRALRAFRAGNTREFRELCVIVNGILARPVALEEPFRMQLRILQILSRVEKDWSIDPETDLTPLEKVLVLLEDLREKCHISMEITEQLKTRIKQAAVVICIRNKQLEQASRILREHLSMDPGCKEMKALLLRAIQEKNFSHPVISQFSYKAFQQRILLFFETYLDDSEPFLLTDSCGDSCFLFKMAKKHCTERLESKRSTAGGASKEEMAASGAAPKAPTTPGTASGEKPGQLRQSSSQAGGIGGTAAKSLPAPGDVLGCLPAASEPTKASPPVDGATGTAEPAAVAPVSSASDDSTQASSLKPAFYVLSVLREAFKSLYDAPDPEEAFSQLDKTDWMYSRPLLPSTSPRAKRQKTGDISVQAVLVVENMGDDSPVSNVLSSAEGEDGRNPPAKPPGTVPPQPSQGEDTPPRTLPPGSRKAGQASLPVLHEEKESWSDEDEIFMDQESRASLGTNTSGTKKKWTSEEKSHHCDDQGPLENNEETGAKLKLRAQGTSNVLSWLFVKYVM
ncbi:telomeric repeat-binding factor 2 isoform X2 [Erythrolamprus reginae]|uniref:telomeric repeat-binding factor 2 isoform X2 n=1 Tax=Erythrolamprus reginae TaxID=121349 RepID=UPI00396CC17B